ncbi:MAG: hypothetical protein O7C01_03230, partial [Actinobacteria bacterium]|nr:hypothetical protein [Actinomycetota bacterium]
GTVLDLAVAAASAEQDDDTRAWALHQRGTRARMLGDRRIARRDLRAAYLLNKRRGKTSQAALSRHNLRQGSGLFPLLRVGASATFLTVASMVVAMAAGAAVAACAISDSCGNEPVTITTEVVTTTGTTIVVAPNLVLNVEAPSEFEPQLVETTSEGSTVIVTNSGDNPLTVSKIGVEGDDALAFPLEGEAQCIREFQPNDECQFEVLFAPTERRVHSAMLLIEVDKGTDETASLTGQGIVSFAGLSAPVWTRPVPMQGIWWEEIARRSFTVEWEAVPFASAYGLEASICWDGESNCDQLSGPQIVSSPFGSVFLPLDPDLLDAKYQSAKDEGLTPVVVLTAYAIGTDGAGAEITSEPSETRHEVTDGPFEMFGVTYDPALGSSLECGQESLSLTVAIQSFLLDPGELTVSTWDGGLEQDTRDEVTAVVSPTATESLAEVSFIPSNNSTLDRIDFLLDSVVGATENVNFPVSGCIE